MEMFVRILQFVGVLNVAFITLNGSYQISSEYFSNTTMITILVILVVISFVKDLLNFIGIEMPYKPLDYFFRLATLVVAGILSSFVILIPKLILIESQQLDSMHVKFTARITRNWSREELTLYLNNLIDSRGISNLISENDRTYIIKTSNSMRELRNSLNNLVSERLLSLNTDVDGPANIVAPVVTGPSWVSENTFLIVAASALAVVVVAGIGYLVHKNYNSSPGVDRDDTSISGGSSKPEESYDGFFEESFLADLGSEGTASSDEGELTVDILNETLAKMSAHTESVKVELGGQIDTIQSKVKELDNINGGLDEQLTVLGDQIDTIQSKVKELDNINGGLDEQLTVLGDRIGNVESDNSRILQANMKHLKNIARRIQELDERVDGVNRVAKTRATELSKRLNSFEKTKLEEAESMTGFVESLVDSVKDQILNTDEVAAVRALINNETIRDMLRSEEIRKITENIKKKG